MGLGGQSLSKLQKDVLLVVLVCRHGDPATWRPLGDCCNNLRVVVVLLGDVSRTCNKRTLVGVRRCKCGLAVVARGLVSSGARVCPS